MSNLPITVTLFIVLAVASFIDIRSRRIPNVLTFSTIGLGLVLNTMMFGLEGTKTSAGGAGLGLAMLLPLFVLRWMGAGDVKLMAAVGALMGPDFVWFACLWGAVFGGGIALIGLWRSKRLSLAFAHLYYSRLLPASGGSLVKAAWRMPYAPAIAMGCVLTLSGARAIAF